MDICTGLDACEGEQRTNPGFTVDEREFERLYTLYLECLRVRALGLREWNRLPEAMRLAVTELIALYSDELPSLRAIDFNASGEGFVSNGKGAGL